MKSPIGSVIFLATAMTLAACSGTADPPGSSTTAAPTTKPPDAGALVDWDDPEREADFGDGWVVAACEGDAPLLCVERDGVLVGVVEAQSYPIASLDALDPAADNESNLNALAADFIAVFNEDRAVGCGSDYRLSPVPAVPFVLANTPGIVYGFEGRLPDGTQSELNFHYATIVGDDVVSITASAYDEGGCPGRDGLGGFDSDTLIEFRPHLEAILHASPLPDVR